MYDELTTDLRRVANTWLAEEYKVCAEAVRYLLKESADAIEELSKERDNWKATAKEERDAYWHWFDQYQKDVPKWIPVTERLPKNDQDVLVMVHWRDYPEDMMCYGRKYKTRWYLWNGELGEIIKGFDITHWMPLPEPPKEET